MKKTTLVLFKTYLSILGVVKPFCSQTFKLKLLFSYLQNNCVTSFKLKSCLIKEMVSLEGFSWFIFGGETLFNYCWDGDRGL
jgi:hypothetical protein